MCLDGKREQAAFRSYCKRSSLQKQTPHFLRGEAPRKSGGPAAKEMRRLLLELEAISGPVVHARAQMTVIVS